MRGVAWGQKGIVRLSDLWRSLRYLQHAAGVGISWLGWGMAGAEKEKEEPAKNIMAMVISAQE